MESIYSSYSTRTVSYSAITPRRHVNQNILTLKTVEDARQSIFVLLPNKCTKYSNPLFKKLP